MGGGIQACPLLSHTEKRKRRTTQAPVQLRPSVSSAALAVLLGFGFDLLFFFVEELPATRAGWRLRCLL